MQITKIAFLGSKEIGLACLKHLIKKEKQLACKVVCVLSNNRKLQSDSEENLSSVAAKAKIPFLNDIDDILELPEIDLLISVQYHKILKEKHLLKAKKLNVNLHMAPLPEYRGCNQFSFAIINKESVFGTSLHQMSVGIDDGPLLAERRFKIPKNCFVDELYDLTFKESMFLFEESLPSLLNGSLKPIEQSSINAKRREIHFRKEINQLKHIDPTWDSEKITRHIRATAMPGFPPPFMIVGKKKIKFLTEYD